MKTERRHELQENELAGWLGEKIKKIMPYSRTIVGILVLATVVMAATAYIRGRGEQALQAGWSAYFDAMSASDAAAFEDVAERFSSTTAGQWALQRAGDLRLDDALRQMFQNREAAQQELQAARENYERLIAKSHDDMVSQRATYGLAKCLESQGHFDDAQKRYEEVISKWSESQFADLARDRVKQLQQPATKEWYAWFAEQKPATSSLTDPSMFQDLPNLPDSPDLQMPNTGPSSTSDESTDDPTGDLLDDLSLDPPSANETPAAETTDDSPLELDLTGVPGADDEADSSEPVTLDLDFGDASDTPASELDDVESDDVELDDVELDDVELDDVELDDVELDDVESDDVELDGVELDGVESVERLELELPESDPES